MSFVRTVKAFVERQRVRVVRLGFVEQSVLTPMVTATWRSCRPGRRSCRRSWPAIRSGPICERCWCGRLRPARCRCARRRLSGRRRLPARRPARNRTHKTASRARALIHRVFTRPFVQWNDPAALRPARRSRRARGARSTDRLSRLRPRAPIGQR